MNQRLPHNIRMTGPHGDEVSWKCSCGAKGDTVKSYNRHSEVVKRKKGTISLVTFQNT